MRAVAYMQRGFRMVSLFVSSRAVGELFEHTFAGAVDHGVDGVETVVAAVVGVGDFAELVAGEAVVGLAWGFAG